MAAIPEKFDLRFAVGNARQNIPDFSFPRHHIIETSGAALQAIGAASNPLVIFQLALQFLAIGLDGGVVLGLDRGAAFIVQVENLFSDHYLHNFGAGPLDGRGKLLLL